MTPEQRHLARHALGLDNGSTVYRNRYVAAWPSPESAAWSQLCDEELAVHTHSGEGSRTYRLTVRGALAAMETHERLSAELLREMVQLEDRAKARGGS